MMWTQANVLLCGLVVVVAQAEVELEADRPFQKVLLHDQAELQCCYSSKASVEATWVMNRAMLIQFLNCSSSEIKEKDGLQCHKCLLKSAQLSDSGLYRCLLNNSKNEYLTHGTFLYVTEPIEPIQKPLNLSENTKNMILTAEGILLLVCVLLPAIAILCQRKRLNELEKKKVTKETENIYQGLNLDECCPKYDQIERFHNCDTYQDVWNASQEDEFQLEKP